MELKLYSNSEIQAPDALLIVPYGIETFQQVLPYSVVLRLLIVPYGIETCNLQ